MHRVLLLLALFPWFDRSAPAETRIRVATYNIWYLRSDMSDARTRNLREVVQQLDANVIGLQEVADRAAIRQIFPADAWQAVIDDQSDDDQDVAVVIRKPARVKGVPENVRDVDAQDKDFLFEGREFESGFANRRDLLMVEVETTGGSVFTVLVHHGKSRREGRMSSEARRVFAAREMIKAFKAQFAHRDFVLLGDFNDNPDDASLNVLETGEQNARAGVENDDGPLLVNLGEILVADDRVSHGVGARDIVGSGAAAHVETRIRDSRTKNNDMRGRDEEVGPILLDQILLPMRMKQRYVSGSVRVFDSPTCVRGGRDKPSDHLPVLADFVFPDALAAGAPPATPKPAAPPAAAQDDGIRILSLLPNPDGEDEGREEITVVNRSRQSISLDGWSLRNHSGRRFNLRGTLNPGQAQTFRPEAGVMPLGNKGDTIELLDPKGAIRQAVSYADAKSGVRVQGK